MNNKQKNNRRAFLKKILSAPTVVGLQFTAGATPKATGKEKIKMLTSDGKVVEVDKSVIEKKAGLKRASDKEIFDWMTSKHKL
jgi:hypothetical protein